MRTVAPLDPHDLDARSTSAPLAAERSRRRPLTGTVADPETFDAAVLDAAAIMRDCPVTDAEPQPGVPDCPEVFLDFFRYVTLLHWNEAGTAEALRVYDVFADRGLL